MTAGKIRSGLGRLAVRFSAISGALVLALAAVGAHAQSAPADSWQEEGVMLENVSRDAASEGRRLREHLTTTNSYRFIGYSLNGRHPYFSRSGNLYRYDGGRRGAEPVLDRSWSLNSASVANVCGKEGFLTRRDNDGDEYHTIHLTAGSAYTRNTLTSGKARRISLTLSQDKTRLAYASSPQNSGRWDLTVHDLCGNTEAQVVASFADSLSVQDWSADGRSLLVSLQGDDVHELFVIDLETKERRELRLSAEPISNARFSADGKHVFFITGGLSDYRALYRYSLDDGQFIDISSGLGRDVDTAVLSPDRTHMALLVNWEGLSRVILLDAVNMRKLDAEIEKSPGVVTDAEFSPDNRRLIMTLTQPESPSRTVVFNLASGRTAVWSGGLSNPWEVSLIPQIVRYPTFDMDGDSPREIPAFLYLPPEIPANTKVPVLISAHGGPASQHRPAFNRTIHYYATELGIAVIEPNIRGSSGYGRAFEALDDGMKREDSIKDIGALLDWIATQPQLDANRVMIAGGSYGGYVSLAVLTKYSDRLRGGIARVGISDFKTFLEGTERNRVNNRRREYGDERDPAMAEFFARISPLANADRITAPLLIIQGANDPRVPAAQAEMIRDAVRANGTDIWYLLSTEDGHRLSSDTGRELSTGAQIAFIKRYLLDE